MKQFVVLAFAALCVGACSKSDALGGRAAGYPVCLASYQVDHTDIPDDSTILFTMRDRSVWANHLQQRCVGLRNDTRGFTYEPTDPGSDTICDDLVLIRLNTYQSVCSLGRFTRVPPGLGR